MIPLLFLVLFAEGAVALLLIVKIGPLRDLIMEGLDQLKTGRGPATVKTLACTMSMILFSSVLSIVRIQNKGTKLGTVTPMDQVLWRTHLLEASLIGYTLFLAFVIDRLHHYLRKLVSLKKTVGTSQKEIHKLQEVIVNYKDREEKASNDIKLQKEEISSFNDKLQNVKAETKKAEKRALDAEAHVAKLQKQSQDLLLEYDRLLEDNQNLQQRLIMKG